MSTTTPLSCRVSSRASVSGFYAANLTNGHGLLDLSAEIPLHDNDAQGQTSWLGYLSDRPDSGDSDLVFDFSHPVSPGKILIWNDNRSGTDAQGKPFTDAGLRRFELFHSIDGKEWSLISPPNGEFFELSRAGGNPQEPPSRLTNGETLKLNGVLCRYLKLRPAPFASQGNWGGRNADGTPCFGLSAVRFYPAEEGFCIRPVPEWNAALKCYEGWTGSDGIFSIPYNGDERPESCQKTDTLFLFSDTFIGNVDRSTEKRSFVMLNNTLAYLKAGAGPERIQYLWRKDGDERPGNFFTPPQTEAFNLKPQDYFWLQDGIILNGVLHCTALNVFNDPGGPEGLKFGIDKISLIRAPLKSGGQPDPANTQISETPLTADMGERGRMFFGCGIFPNHPESGMPNADGYLYVYGYLNLERHSDMLAARVRPEDFTDFSEWRFFDGEGWNADIRRSAIVAEDVSHELSVSYMDRGPFAGKYILIYQRGISSPYIDYRIADNPWGPFGESRCLYYCPEVEDGQSAITYNAKAHPHLSAKGRLLISYNVNTLSMTVHERNGTLYRPRFIEMTGTQDR